jgi:hypothetical protein
MGRADNEELTAAQIFYPCMQCADIFFLKVSIFILPTSLNYLHNVDQVMDIFFTSLHNVTKSL